MLLSFGYGYFNRNETREFLGAVEAGMAAESILPWLARTRWFRRADMPMLSENRYDPAESRLEVDYTFVRAGG